MAARKPRSWYDRTETRKRKKKRVSFTDEQIASIASRVLGTGANVYYVAAEVAGCPAEDIDSDVLFEPLRKHGIFKCEECNTWRELDDEAAGFFETCNACADALEEDD